MAQRSFKDTIKMYAAEKAIEYLNEKPEKAIPKLINWAEKIDKDNNYVNQIREVKKVTSDPDSNWNKLINSVWTDIDKGQSGVLLKNFFLNASLEGSRIQEEMKKKHGCGIPWAILLDPTSACNLHCTGCWAAEYGNKLNMSYETLDDIINQATALGTYFFLFTGGEPLVRKKDIIKLCEAHSDCIFLSFTNGTLIDEEFADEMLRVKNFVPAISIEGFEEATDSRRGKGTYQAVMRAMKILKERKLLFGISCCYTRQNTEVIGSEEYIDAMIEMGAKFAWFFTYMPVCVDASTDLMVTAAQREYMYNQIREFRNTKPLFTMDFWNDGEYVNGCIAGARYYLHINANGDIEPCAFIHYSDSNIYEKTLLEAYKAPFFTAYREGQPFSDNLLRPCPLLDNPGALEEIVKKTGAKSTDLMHPEDVHDLTEKCAETAEKWKVAADRIWECSAGCARCRERAEIKKKAKAQ